jgi:CheY-like chemotaxis protein
MASGRSSHLGTPDSCDGGSARPPRLLIVDDEPRVLGVLVDYFREQGYAIEMATADAAALVAIRERRPDVVLLDLNMPGVLDGRAVLRAIGSDIPVIVVTGINDPDDARTMHGRRPGRLPRGRHPTTQRSVGGDDLVPMLEDKEITLYEGFLRLPRRAHADGRPGPSAPRMLLVAGSDPRDPVRQR